MVGVQYVLNNCLQDLKWCFYLWFLSKTVKKRSTLKNDGHEGVGQNLLDCINAALPSHPSFSPCGDTPYQGGRLSLNEALDIVNKWLSACHVLCQAKSLPLGSDFSSSWGPPRPSGISPRRLVGFFEFLRVEATGRERQQTRWALDSFLFSESLLFSWWGGGGGRKELVGYMYANLQTNRSINSPLVVLKGTYDYLTYVLRFFCRRHFRSNMSPPCVGERRDAT